MNPLTMALSLLFGFGGIMDGGPVAAPSAFRGSSGPAPRRWFFGKPSRKYWPHQGARECNRRIGGERWAMHKAVDRMQRGLSPEK